MQEGRSLALLNAEERAIYVAKGSLKIQDTVVPEFAMVILTAADGIVIEATANSRIALIGGETVGKRFIEWNFISSRKERVEQVKRDWQSGAFPKVIDDEEEFIPLP
jgi:hypothetical protein